MKKSNQGKSSKQFSLKDYAKDPYRNGKGKTGNSEPAPYRGKASQSGSKQDRRAENIADTGASMSRGNPVSFYDKYTQFAHDAAKLPMALPLGANYTVKRESIETGEIFNYTYNQPGIMVLKFAPTVGFSDSANSPMNASSINYYARLRQTQKAFGDYDHQDLTIMMLAIDSAAMFHALGRRIYGLLTDMTPLNRYYPRGLVGASGIQFTDVEKTIQDFRAFLNEYAIQLQQYGIPKGISLIERHQWMCEGIYTDSESSRAQTYMFVPTGFWQYSATGAVGSELVWVPYPPFETNTSQTITIADFMALGRQLISALQNQADFAVMAGDLYAYYNTSELMQLPYVEERYAILPKYDEIVLSQIENATIVGGWATGYTPIITQDPSVGRGVLIFKPVCDMGVHTPVDTLRLNFHHDNVTEDDVLEATRLMCKPFSDQTATPSNTSFYINYFGSEIVMGLKIYAINPTTQGFRAINIDSMTVVIGASSPAQEYLNAYTNILYLQKFDWAPRVELFWSNSTAATDIYLGSSWDVDNMAPIADWQLENINTAALYSLFAAWTH